ncbi:MAG: signal recognition particle-docking protein FtsY [Syntrophobacteraceae bacterium]
MIKWFKRKKNKEGEKNDKEPAEEIESVEESASESPASAADEIGARAQGTPRPQTEWETQEQSETSDSQYAMDDEVEPEEEEEELGEGDVPRRGLFKRLRNRLKGTRQRFANRIDRLVLGRKVIDEDLLDELEEILITSDLGVKTTTTILGKVADKVKRKELSDPGKLREQIRTQIRAALEIEAPALDYRAHKPLIILIVGVNGTGKTTTTGKLAAQLKQQGLKPMLVACDTFRAAAVEQLSIWAERIGVPVVKQKSGSDPSSVAFDALDAALSRDIDVVLIDTAGRMHTKVNLMEELKKIYRVVEKKMPGAPHEVFLVLDGSTGQNALSQAKLFKEGIGLTGLILTKLDGTAKGGVVAAICEELQVPVRYIGIGESVEDLRTFDAEEFTRALF